MMVTKQTTTTTTVVTTSDTPLQPQVPGTILQPTALVHQNYAHLIGRPITEVEQALRGIFPDTVVIFTPGQVPDVPTATRLQVFVDDQNIITKIVYG
jgi:hypothetical protein